MTSEHFLGDNYKLSEDSNGDLIIEHVPSGDSIRYDSANTGFVGDNFNSLSTEELNNTVVVDGSSGDVISEVNSELTTGGAGTVVKIEPGNYTTSTKLSWTADDQTVIALGAEITWSSGFDTTAIVPGGYADSTLLFGTFDHNGANQTGGNGLSTAGSGQRFIGTTIRNAAETAFRASGGGTDIKFINCRAISPGQSLSTQQAGTGDGFYLENVTYSEVVAPYVESPWRAGVVFEGGTSTNAVALQGGAFFDCPIGVDHAAVGAAAAINGPVFYQCGTTGRNYATDIVADIQLETNGCNVNGWASYETNSRSIRIAPGCQGNRISDGVVWRANTSAADSGTTGVIERQDSTGADGFVVENVEINHANDVSGVIWNAPDNGVTIENVGGKSVFQGVKVSAAAQGVIKGCYWSGGTTAFNLGSGHEFKLRDNWETSANGSFLNDFAIHSGNTPGLSGDVRAINNPPTNARAFHDGTNTNTAGPAFYDGSGWVSLVDGSTIT